MIQAAGLMFSVLLTAPAGPVTAAAITTPAAPVPDVKVVLDVPYRDLAEGEDPAKKKNKLDLFLPVGDKPFPVLVFIHGGAWIRGDKDFMGVYSSLGKSLARRGVGVAVPNYRLSPGVKHPEHIRDVARAFGWVHKNIARYGGRPDRMFVAGHSAGGHLAALLASDPTWLRAEGLDLSIVRGAVPMSGVYHIPETMTIFSPIFGDLVADRRAASPVNQARAGLPPFLLIFADDDLGVCGKVNSEEFAAALRGQKVPVDLLEVTRRNHVSVLFRACQAGDPAGEALLKFVRTHEGTAPVSAAP